MKGLGLLGVLVAGGAVGVALQRSGTVDLVDEGTEAAAYAETSYFDCPAGDALGSFVRGDRVYLVGRDDSGGWVQVRSPRDVDERVWIAANQVAEDAVVDLPVGTCAIEVQAQGVSSDTTVVTESTVPGDTSPSTTAAVPGPAVGQVSSSHQTIEEAYGSDLTCSATGLPAVATISAPVSNATTVTMRWSVGAVSGSKVMTLSGGVYLAILGTFGAEAPNVVPQGESRTITVTVEAVGAGGRIATGQTTVTLADCSFG